MPKVDYTDFRALRTMAMKYAWLRGTKDFHLCEDFGQEYCLAVWQGKSTSLHYAYTDFMRNSYGRTDGKPYQDHPKAYALLSMQSYDQMLRTKRGRLW